MKLDYLDSVKKQFEYYKSVGEKTFQQLDEEDFMWRFNKESNSIAIIVNHLWGNMKSRWTDFLTTDGEKTWRNRDREFEDKIKTKEDLVKVWQEAWECLFEALSSINKDNFKNEIYIRNEAHNIVEAVNRQLAHYSYHIGQIVFIGKMIKGNDWKSLSIPKGKSEAYNAEKFSEK